jgi:hypothetical protein
MTIDRNMNSSLIHISGDKLSIVSIIDQQKATNNLHGLNPSIDN